MLKVGQQVGGRVVGHEPYGAFVDIGEQELAVLLLDAVVEDPSLARDSVPPIGAQIEAVFLGYGRAGGSQPRISIQRSVMGTEDPAGA